jgi:hypothetical protein
LNDSVRFVIDGGRGLVKNEQLALTHEGTSKGEDLTLANGEIAATACDGAVECQAGCCLLSIMFLQCEKAGGAKRFVQDDIIMLPEWIQILSQGPTQKLGL